MLVFSTKSSLHLAKRIVKLSGFTLGEWESYKFSDGELYVRLKNNIANKQILIIGSTETPAENYFELWFLIEAALQNKARPIVVVPYFGYARANRIERAGEAHRTRFIGKIFKKFKAPIFVLDIHDRKSIKLIGRNTWNFMVTNLAAAKLAKVINTKNCVIAAPDFGAKKRAEEVAAALSIKQTLILRKQRKGAKIKLWKPRLDVKTRDVVLVDDIFATGSTLTKAAKILRDIGFKNIYGFVTHGVFCDFNIKQLETNPLRKVFVTNSLKSGLRHRKLQYIDISKNIATLVKNAVYKTKD